MAAPGPTSAPRPARPGAHPVSARRLPAAIPLARLAARTAPRAAGELARCARTGSLQDLRAAKRTLVVSFRRDGTPVPTPVWAAHAGGVLYVRSERSSGKLKRLRNDARVLLAPCTARGRPLGPPLEAHGYLLARADEPVAERALAARYGLGRELLERTMDLLRIEMCYLRLEPGAWADTPI
jgi:PPOX class probable F420-dependent enzyme